MLTSQKHLHKNIVRTSRAVAYKHYAQVVAQFGYDILEK